MCANSSGDPFHTPAPFDGVNQELPIRVGIALTPGGREPHADITNALKNAATQLEDAGYIVDEVELPELNRASEIYTQIMGNYGRLTAEPKRAPVGVISEEFDQFWAAFAEPWEAATGEVTHDPMMERGVIAHAWGRMMEKRPLILAPIATLPAWKVGSDLKQEFNATWLESLRSVVAINLLGLPSVALPIGLAGGLPHGVQIIGRRFREDLCLQAAEAIETRLQPITPIEPHG
jgi:amidase